MQHVPGALLAARTRGAHARQQASLTDHAQGHTVAPGQHGPAPLAVQITVEPLAVVEADRARGGRIQEHGPGLWPLPSPAPAVERRKNRPRRRPSDWRPRRTAVPSRPRSLKRPRSRQAEAVATREHRRGARVPTLALEAVQ